MQTVRFLTQYWHLGCAPLHLILRERQLQHARDTRVCLIGVLFRGRSCRRSRRGIRILSCLCALAPGCDFIGNIVESEVESRLPVGLNETYGSAGHVHMIRSYRRNRYKRLHQSTTDLMTKERTRQVYLNVAANITRPQVSMLALHLRIYSMHPELSYVAS
jgi:hypothetical protein